MTPILTTDERVARDSKYNQHDIDSRDDIVLGHLNAELVETQEALKQRTVAYIPSEHDLSVLKGLKREFIDRMIGSGIQYQLCGKVSALLETMMKDLQDNMQQK
jgi:hypothetical protein